jgi:hypothetical protein
VQNRPRRHEQSDEKTGTARLFLLAALPDRLPEEDAEQSRFDALTEPSLQTKMAPLQWDIPPFRPLHGVFWA